MTKVRLSGAARAELREIRLYSVEHFGRSVADRYLRGFADVFRLIGEHPQIGPVEEGLDRRVRTYTYRRHLIVYRFDGEQLVVSRILHQARDLARALRESGEE